MNDELFPWSAMLLESNGVDEIGCVQAKTRRQCLDLATAWVRKGGRAQLFYQGVAQNFIGANEGGQELAGLRR